MKKIYKKLPAALLAGTIMTVISSCERPLSDDVRPATFPQTAEIFTDNFVGLGTNFYFPFVPDGAKPDVFSVDEEFAYLGTSSIRIDVPNADDPGGGFAGANFVIDGVGRDLTGFDALTFWVRSSQAATIGSVGFGIDFRAALSDVDITTSWRKITIPIPDPSKLLEERTVFGFSAGGIGDVPGEEVGYTFWMDEIRFEKLGTIAQPRPAVLGGQDVTTDAFIGQSFAMTPLSQTFNLADGSNQTVSATAAYFVFTSSDTNIATVDDEGIITVLAQGQVEISGTLNGVEASGSLSLNVLGEFNRAPIPTRDAANVFSVFSNEYTNPDGLNIAVFNNQEISIEVSNFNGDEVISYGNLGFVGIGWNGTTDVSIYDFLHVDVQVDQPIVAGNRFVVELVAPGVGNAGGFSIDGSGLSEGDWIVVDIPINGFTATTGGGGTGSPDLTSIANVVFVGQGINNVLVDNIYFYKQ